MNVLLRRILLIACAIAATENFAIANVWTTLFGGGSRALYDSDCLPSGVKPHAAVARIIVPEGGCTAFGSGTLVGVRGDRALVVTNWHVVRDSAGTVEVVFPDGFRSHARPLKVDQDWDLAALVIWRPTNIDPVKISLQPPRPGEPLTIHGYGRGKYRVATGRCTNYYSPLPNFPHEIIELDVEARQGDSGGPIFNSSGELAGVLFGAGQGTTMGSFAPRVRVFLTEVAPDIDLDSNTQIAVADRPPPAVTLPDLNQVAQDQTEYPSSQWSPPKVADGRNTDEAFSSAWRPPAKAEDAAANRKPRLASTTAPSPADDRQTLSWSDLSRTTWYETAKTVLAAVGLAVVALRVVKVVR